MFGFGLKSRDVDMLSRTLAELQELRTEISVLREQLVMIKPVNPENDPDLVESECGTEGGGMAARAVEDVQVGEKDESMAEPQAAVAGEDKPEAVDLGEPAIEAFPDDITVSQIHKDSMAAKVKSIDADTAKDAGEEFNIADMNMSGNDVINKTKIKREWAVVDYKSWNRQWWQIWR